MSVHVSEYYGNAGNHMFQYFTAFLFSHINHLYFATEMSEKMKKFIAIKRNINETKTKPLHKSCEKIITCKDIVNGYIPCDGACTYIFKDYFQHSSYLNSHAPILLDFFELSTINKKIPVSLSFPTPSKHDVLCILRIGDFVHSGHNSEVVHPHYFHYALKQIEQVQSIDNIYFMVHPVNDSLLTKYLNHLGEYSSKIKPLCTDRNELFDFHVPYYFHNIIMTNSTFNWWSLFFQPHLKEKRVFMPKYMGYLGLFPNMKSHGLHVKELWNIRNMTHCLEHEFIHL